MGRRRKKALVPEAQPALERFKYEVAEDLGLADKIAREGWGEMTSRECGLVGGNMVKRMIEYAEEKLSRPTER
ncbi:MULTISPECIES: alpha/beta-type small acid-soluble spore protein [Ammonifex]|uniref:Small acid-soluble spore protein alpha/beta type n=2 Tax=Ammonifex TaxID=42837 RepID=C9RBX0_AMMDK|nr:MULTISPECIES: alpha/beta-type small acid-soluble spore protein [Ammonifex]ACX51747.1 small acid-soluble spore protein alpha/beta type [Ammonifex degensii KC4]RDV82473.1 small acid-soluble spore protein [Ammonifex thiophilus]